jgi:hypothetical protein
MQGRTALITGGSTGLGLAMAHENRCSCPTVRGDNDVEKPLIAAFGIAASGTHPLTTIT